MGHDEKLLATKALVLRDQAGKAFKAEDVGMVILSGPKIWFNSGSKWELVTSA